MGCNCGKSKTAQTSSVSAASRRVTVYQVMVDGSVASEFGALPEARKEATALGGRVKVTSKMISS